MKKYILIAFVATLSLIILPAVNKRTVLAGGSLGSFNRETKIVKEIIHRSTITAVPSQIFPDTDTSSTESRGPMFSKEAILSIIISTLSGGILAFLLVILVDYLKKPIILFEKGSEAISGKKHWKFIHIRVGNYKRRFKYIPINTQVAFSTRAVVSITDGKDTKMFIGRWTSKAQPIGNEGTIINTALVHPREDIHPSDRKDEAVEIAIGLKYEGENEFYGFNNESYLHTDFKRQDLKFGIGQFNGKITLSTLGYKYSKKFQINNSSKKRENFWLKVL